MTPVRQVLVCTQATFPTLSSLLSGVLIYVSDYAHFIFWDGSAAKFAGDPSGRIEGFLVDPGTGWHLCDGSTVTYLKPDGTTGSVTLPNLTSSPAYPKYGASVTGINAAHAAGISGTTSNSTTGDTVSTTSSSVDNGDGSHGSSSFLDSASLNPALHNHTAGTLVCDTTGEPANVVLRPWFRL